MYVGHIYEDLEKCHFMKKTSLFIAVELCRLIIKDEILNLFEICQPIFEYIKMEHKDIPPNIQYIYTA